MAPLLIAALVAGLVQVSLFTALGLGIRAGKPWAKGIYLILLAYALYLFSRSIPFFMQRSLWTSSKEMLALVLLLGIAFFLFRDTLTRRTAAPDAGRAEGGHNRPN